MADRPAVPSHDTLPAVPIPLSITSARLTAVVLAIAALEYGQGFFAPLAAAVLLSIALAPPVRWLSRLMPRGLAAAVVVLAIVGIGAAAGYTLSDDLARSSRELPGLVRQLRSAVAAASPRDGLIRQLQQAVSELQRSASTPDTGAAKVTIVEPVDVQWGVMAGTRRLAEWLSLAALMLFLVYFLLATGDLFKQRLVKLAGDRWSHRKVTMQLLDEITVKIGRFVFYQVWSGLLVGAVTWIAFSLFGVRYAGLWGVAAAVLNCVPYVGPTAVMAGSALAAFIQFQSLTTAAMVAGVSVLVTGLEGFVFAPLMLGRAARVNTVATFVALMFWGWLWGGIGLVIAVPVLMIVKTIADHVESLAPLSELLAEREQSPSVPADGTHDAQASPGGRRWYERTHVA